MELETFLTPERMVMGVTARSKKGALELIGELAEAQNVGLQTHPVLEKLFDREMMGSTGIGNGVALPHARFKDCERPLALLVLLEDGINFEAPDREPVDILMTVIAPENDTISAEFFAAMLKAFSSQKTLNQLRHAHCSDAMYEIVEKAFNNVVAPPSSPNGKAHESDYH